MNETVFDIDFTRALPPTLKNDENMLALAKVVAGELQTTARLSRSNIIYARMNELEENMLDILAYDLHVDWYDDDYPVEVKRELLKTSIRVHKKMGTVYAVSTALGALYPNAKIEEWFHYGGKPLSFRINIDIFHAKIVPKIKDIIMAVNTYKRLTAHLEKIIYRYSLKSDIKTISFGGMGVTIKVKPKVKKSIAMETMHKNIAITLYTNTTHIYRKG